MGGCLGTPLYPDNKPLSQSLVVKVTTLRKKSEPKEPFEKCLANSKVLKIDESAFKPHQTSADDNTGSPNLQIKELAKVNWKQQTLEIITNNTSSNDERSELNERFWIIVENGPKERGYVLSPGDTIAFGKVNFRVKSIQTGYSEIISRNFSELYSLDGKSQNRTSPITSRLSQELTNDSSPPHLKTLDWNEYDREKPVCRICLDDTSNEDNPITRVCKCSGTIKDIHIECLKHWCSERIVTKSTSCLSSFYWERLKCELCQQELANELFINGRYFSLINIPTVSEPHVTLECFMKDNSNGFHIIKFTKKKNTVTIGRGDNCNIKINDLSVSRDHATIKYEDGSFLLQSNSQKMGTRVLIPSTEIPFHMLNNIKIKFKNFIFEITTVNNDSSSQK